LLHHTQRTVFHPSLRNVSLNVMGWAQFRDLWFEPAPSKPAFGEWPQQGLPFSQGI